MNTRESNISLLSLFV